MELEYKEFHSYATCDICGRHNVWCSSLRPELYGAHGFTKMCGDCNDVVSRQASLGWGEKTEYHWDRAKDIMLEVSKRANKKESRIMKYVTGFFRWIWEHGSAIFIIGFFGFMIAMYIYDRSDSVQSARTDYNVRAVIISINDKEESLSQDKFHRPQLCNSALFRNLENDKYFTFTSCGNCVGSNCIDGVNLNHQWVYNHSPGDTVFFKVLAKKRYFDINKD